MENFTSGDIARALGTVSPVDCALTGICTDTRKLFEGCAFVALRGENFDGTSFASLAFEKGARVIVADRQIDDLPCIVTTDARASLLKIAALYRNRFSPLLVGVTGSVGKTTTKDMLALTLSEKFKVLKTLGNLNNDIGLPQTLFGLDSSFGAAVIEMGMSDFGEIKALSEAAKPNIAVITNIGWSHIQNLKTREGILRAKLEILCGMDADAPLVVCADNEYLAPLKALLGRPVITFGIDNTKADFSASDIHETDSACSFTVNTPDNSFGVSLEVSGRHNILNALASCAVGKFAGLNCDEIARALKKFKPEAMRQNIICVGTNKVIADCYNASPDSMKSALELLGSQSCNGKKIAVLGDMLELGTHSKLLHKLVGEYAADSDAELILCFGSDSREIAEVAAAHGKDAEFFATREELADVLRAKLGENDTVLFKASRGMKTESVIKSVFGEILS